MGRSLFVDPPPKVVYFLGVCSWVVFGHKACYLTSCQTNIRTKIPVRFVNFIHTVWFYKCMILSAFLNNKHKTNLICSLHRRCPSPQLLIINNMTKQTFPSKSFHRKTSVTFTSLTLSHFAAIFLNCELILMKGLCLGSDRGSLSFSCLEVFKFSSAT